MKKFIIIQLIAISISVVGCEKSDTPKTISASATATSCDSGEIVIRDATKSEVESINLFHEKIQKINKMYPAPPMPLNQETFAVRSITDEGVFILENDLRVKMSGIKCLQNSAFFLRKFFVEDTERLAYMKDGSSENGIIESYIWIADSSLMRDPEMKGLVTSPSYSGMNDIVILNNWCEIEHESTSKYLSRYVALKKISRKNRRYRDRNAHY